MKTLTPTDHELIELLKKGKLSAFDDLFFRYSQQLYRFCFSMLKNHEDAEEIVQEVFFKLWVKRNEISKHKSFQSYLFTIAYNLTVDQFRKRSRQKEFEKQMLQKAQRNDLNTLGVVEHEELNNLVLKVINRLPAKRRKIYVLSRERGMNYKDIADILQISTKTVENQINLALKQIRQVIGKEHNMI